MRWRYGLIFEFGHPTERSPKWVEFTLWTCPSRKMIVGLKKCDVACFCCLLLFRQKPESCRSKSWSVGFHPVFHYNLQYFTIKIFPSFSHFFVFRVFLSKLLDHRITGDGFSRSPRKVQRKVVAGDFGAAGGAWRWRPMGGELLKRGWNW